MNDYIDLTGCVRIEGKMFQYFRLYLDGNDNWCYHWIEVKCERCGWSAVASITPHACIAANSYKDNTAFTITVIPIVEPGTFP